jgi:hypothetical protein
MGSKKGNGMKPTAGERLERVNVMLSRQDSSFLDQLPEEIHTQTGARVSRSEIVRAALAGLKELHRLAPETPSRFVPLAQVRSGADLVIWMILAIRWACPREGPSHIPGSTDMHGATTHRIHAEGA